MTHKKFMDIQRIKPESTDGFNVGDYIVIQEKIDGANAAIRYDSETDTIKAQSRKNILGIGNNLRGFYEWSQTLDKELVASVLGITLYYLWNGLSLTLCLIQKSVIITLIVMMCMILIQKSIFLRVRFRLL